MESTRIETEPLRDFLATDAEWTADLQERAADETADLPDENIADRSPTIDKDKSHDEGASTSSPLTTRDRPLSPMPDQRAFGFLAFAACVLVALLTTTERSPPATGIALAGSPPSNAATPPRTQPIDSAVDSDGVEKLVAAQPMQSAGSKSKSAGASATLGVLAFESRTFATSEKAVAAVFIIRRTQIVRGGAVVQWAARSGSADAGIDFSDASGTVRFADGQRQRAIYVPLRNDLLAEEDETFKVCLRSPRQARIGGSSCAEATIRDDDAIPPDQRSSLLRTALVDVGAIV